MRSRACPWHAAEARAEGHGRHRVDGGDIDHPNLCREDGSRPRTVCAVSFFEPAPAQRFFMPVLVST
jgi:hypothetical protein